MPKPADDNLLVGFCNSDDACVYRINKEQAIINTLDFFPPMVDDPFAFGQIAAANALSDVYAMGGTPVLAMNILGFPPSLDVDVVEEILKGGESKVSEASAVLAGGHSIEANEPIYGLSVTGIVHPSEILTNAASDGDVLVTTKPIGVGIMLTGLKAEMLSETERDKLIEVMTTLNKSAAIAMRGHKVSACTDITGFGILGHAYEMASAGSVRLELSLSKLPLIEPALALARQGFIPAGAYRNQEYLSDKIETALDTREPEIKSLMNLAYDPETSGGLLIAVKPSDLDGLVKDLKQRGCEAAVLGRFASSDSTGITIVE